MIDNNPSSHRKFNKPYKDADILSNYSPISNNTGYNNILYDPNQENMTISNGIINKRTKQPKQKYHQISFFRSKMINAAKKIVSLDNISQLDDAILKNYENLNERLDNLQSMTLFANIEDKENQSRIKNGLQNFNVSLKKPQNFASNENKTGSIKGGSTNFKSPTFNDGLYNMGHPDVTDFSKVGVNPKDEVENIQAKKLKGKKDKNNDVQRVVFKDISDQNSKNTLVIDQSQFDTAGSNDNKTSKLHKAREVYSKIKLESRNNKISDPIQKEEPSKDPESNKISEPIKTQKPNTTSQADTTVYPNTIPEPKDLVLKRRNKDYDSSSQIKIALEKYNPNQDSYPDIEKQKSICKQHGNIDEQQDLIKDRYLLETNSIKDSEEEPIMIEETPLPEPQQLLSPRRVIYGGFPKLPVEPENNPNNALVNQTFNNSNETLKKSLKKKKARENDDTLNQDNLRKMDIRSRVSTLVHHSKRDTIGKHTSSKPQSGYNTCSKSQKETKDYNKNTKKIY